MKFYDFVSSGASLSAKGNKGCVASALLKPFLFVSILGLARKEAYKQKSGSKSHATLVLKFAGRPAAAKGKASRSEPLARVVANPSLQPPLKPPCKPFAKREGWPAALPVLKIPPKSSHKTMVKR